MFEPGATQLHFDGRIGDRLSVNQENWFQTAPARNPRMLGVLRDRKTGPPPPPSLLQWVGEYPGKYLLGAVHALRISGDNALRDVIATFVRDLIATQGDDGYLGPFGPGERLPNPGKWDLWGHYHCMLGLLRWHQDQNHPEALAACRRAADFICNTYLGANRRTADEGDTAKNEAVSHVFLVLHRVTGEPRYLRMAQEIEADWGRPDGGNYVNGFQHGEAFYQSPQARWESLHDVQAILEFYLLNLDWQPWFPLGPNTFPGGSPVSALSTRPGGTSLFVVGLDRQVWSTFFDPGNLGPPALGGWQPWFALGPNVFATGSKVTALSTMPGGTSLFILGLDGRVWSTFFDPNKPGWQPWFPISPNTFPAGSAVTALSTRPGGTSLFILGLDGRVWSTFFDPQNPGWQPWFPLGPNTFPLHAAVAAISTKPGGTSLFISGLDGQVWSTFFDPQNPAWQPWFALGPNTFPVGSAVTALSTRPGGSSLFVLGLDARVWSTLFDPHTPGWKPWFPLGPNTFPPGATVTALSTRPGGTSLFVLGLDRQVWSTFFDPQNLGPPALGGWQPWFPLGPNVFPAGAPVAALSTKPGGTSLFVPGLDGRIWSTFYDPANLGRDRYYRAFTRIWRSILQFDRHITGGFSSAEAASGDPFDPRPIETCATVAWMCLTLDMLRLTGESQPADELELSTWNAVLGSQSPDGDWWTYDTPMGGIPTLGMVPLGWPLSWPDPMHRPPRLLAERCPTRYDLRWQDYGGVPNQSCCSLNGPRGLVMLSEWAVMRAPDGIVVNFYGPSQIHAATPAGATALLAQQTNYPVGGLVRLTVTPANPERFVLRLRIPAWSQLTTVRVNGQPAPAIQPGAYLSIDRLWSPADTVELEFDMCLRFVSGERDATGRMAVYRGPLLLAYDARFDRFSPEALPAIARDASPTLLPNPGGPSDPQILLRFPTLDGQSVTLCDFASAGIVPWIPTRRWQFSRSDGTLLAASLTLRADGTLQGATNPNESRWGFEDIHLTFYDSQGAATTRFTAIEVPGDRTRLEGKFLPNPAITHVLRQLDGDFDDTIWDFDRGGAVSPIRLEPDGRIHGYLHPNEASWKRDGATLVFCDQQGAPTTRFTSVSRVGEHRELAGNFVPNPSIVHRLRELDLGWVRGSAYVSWLPAPAPGPVTAIGAGSSSAVLAEVGAGGLVRALAFDPGSIGSSTPPSWQTLGPNRFPAGSPVTAVSPIPGAVSLFVLGFDRQLWCSLVNSGVRQPWFPLGPETFPAGSQVAAVSTTAGGTSLYILGEDGRVWSTYYDPRNLGPAARGGWQPWFPLGANVFPQSSPVAAISTAPGETSLFVTGFDSQIWSTYFDPRHPGPPDRGGWQPWFPLGPNVFPAPSTITAISAAPGATSLYILGLEGRVWNKEFDPARPGPPDLGGWQPWTPIGPPLAAPFPAVSRVAAVKTAPDASRLYILGSDGKVWLAYAVAGARHAWTPLEPSPPHSGWTVRALSAGGGDAAVFVSSLDGEVWCRFDPGNPNVGQPSGWFSVG